MMNGAVFFAGVCREHAEVMKWPLSGKRIAMGTRGRIEHAGGNVVLDPSAA
jgi:hypothetical protein